MKIRLTSECGVGSPDDRRALCAKVESLAHERREHLPTYLSTHARPVFVVHHSIWPRVRAPRSSREEP